MRHALSCKLALSYSQLWRPIPPVSQHSMCSVRPGQLLRAQKGDCAVKDFYSASSSKQQAIPSISLACAGSMYCFRVADAYLKGFSPIRSAVVTGNHDLEGEDFETDEANLAAWTKVSSSPVFWPGNTGSFIGLPVSAIMVC